VTTLGFDVGVKRGYQEITFTHPRLGRVALFNTHLQAFPNTWHQRMEQVRELGLAMRNERRDDTVVLAGGDMNSAPYYPENNRHGDNAHWWNNALAYPLLQHYSGTRDLAVMGRTFAESNDDVERPPERAPNGTVTPRYPYTVSQVSNGLYRQQYGDAEYEARIDHILGGAARGRIHVAKSELTFTDRVPVTGGAVSELSDHFGERVLMRVVPARP
jgi:endonuclease/exonuclease/phosphatase family metal-dependent hydrolase